MTAPLTSADMDIRALDGFMLNVERLLASELWALTKKNPVAFRAAVALWARAWKQIPPCSLPCNDSVICVFAEVPRSVFNKNRDLIMRGFVLCTDNRYYHRKLAEEANKIWPSVIKKREQRAADNERLKRWREQQRNASETRVETQNEMRSVGIDTDTDRDTDKKKKEKSIGKERGTRWPDGAVIPEEWFQLAAAKRAENNLPEIDLRLAAEKFVNYWTGLSGARATKRNWRATWINWTLNNYGAGNGNGKSPTAHDSFFAAAKEIINERLERAGSGGGDVDPVPFGHPLLPS